ncbi:JmjC domain-containing protein [Phlyctema vagabunda]|uniref:JmjC domain-containing protein n=1 Tax=Phlyctema vagabunda TaxID=108571 RepID=A0ABR4PBD1_9HELO
MRVHTASYLRGATLLRPNCHHRIPFHFGLPSIQSRRAQSSFAVKRISCPLDRVNVEKFRELAFLPQLPMLISPDAKLYPDSIASVVPAASKWFQTLYPTHNSAHMGRYVIPAQEYLSPFAETIVPYETTITAESQDIQAFESTWPLNEFGKRSHYDEFIYEATHNFEESYLDIDKPPAQEKPTPRFCRFNAPLSLFLKAFEPRSADIPQIKHLYIAQAQISELPHQLRDDLPTPELVKKAGKGDIYDTSIWMGLQPTYTPLHKDPNPNLFIQIANSKTVRLYSPTIGASIFREAQAYIGASSSASFRGTEMMQGSEKEVLEEIVWGSSTSVHGMEVVLNPGDALFIPKGWWHSIKSHDSGMREVNASVNWWFR